MNSTTNYIVLKSRLKASIDKSGKKALFFKTGEGHYAQHDQFINVSVPILRKLAKEFSDLTHKDVQTLMQSFINEERLLGLFILIGHYKKAKEHEKQKIYLFYIKNLKYVNNWNLVDSSAHLIIGAQLLNKDKGLLIKLAKSKNIWKRRVAIISTLYFIKKNQLSWTYKIAKILLHDEHDLIHKSVGWMLRETGKINPQHLKLFLDKYSHKMPRTMLRYSIERFSKKEQKKYLNRS